MSNLAKSKKHFAIVQWHFPCEWEPRTIGMCAGFRQMTALPMHVEPPFRWQLQWPYSCQCIVWVQHTHPPVHQRHFAHNTRAYLLRAPSIWQFIWSVFILKQKHSAMDQKLSYEIYKYSSYSTSYLPEWVFDWIALYCLQLIQSFIFECKMCESFFNDFGHKVNLLWRQGVHLTEWSKHQIKCCALFTRSRHSFMPNLRLCKMQSTIWYSARDTVHSD